MVTEKKLRIAIGGVLLAVVGFSGTAANAEPDLLKANGVDDEAVAEAYYETIDPNDERLTQYDWELVNGYHDPINEIVEVAGHFNASDLGFWRRISMVEDKRRGHKGNIAFTTVNYATEYDAVNDLNAVSIVNMEYSPGPEGDRITKFYIYDGATGARLTKTVFDPDPATAEELYLPAGCFSCHGGDDDAEAPLPDGYNDGSGETNSGFLAFDFNVFEYGSLVSRAEQEAAVKRLNKGVLRTDPSRAVRKLVRGLYGGKSLPRATQDSSYMPSSWVSEPELYQVIVTDCLGCHTLSDSKVLSLEWWKSNTDELREAVFEDNFMPNSPFAHRRFWSNGNVNTVLDAIVRFESGG
ncbi:MAG: hypothetical protein V2J55_22875 [Candidatus Competibacteraceae bacterium]|jgi:hypothetical protein|nr:hypothetical protein [Candidatus Competibacteraceae bacterium]